MTISIKLEKPIARKKVDLPNAYELGNTLFGHFSSDGDYLSSNRKAILKKKLRAKHRQPHPVITH